MIDKIIGLEVVCKTLENLNLAENKLCKIEGLDSMKNLKLLNLKNNLIFCVEGLPASIEDIDLTNNKVSKVELTVNPINLKRLNLTKNNVSDPKILHKFTALEDLNLDSNPINKSNSKEYTKTLISLFDLFTQLKAIDSKLWKDLEFSLTQIELKDNDPNALHNVEKKKT